MNGLCGKPRIIIIMEVVKIFARSSSHTSAYLIRKGKFSQQQLKVRLSDN